MIASERERRNAPAVIAMGKLHPDPAVRNDFVGKFFRLKREIGVWRRALMLIAQTSGAKPRALLLPSRGHKYEELRNELVDAGAGSGAFSYIPSGAMLNLRGLLLIGIAFTSLIFVRSRLFKKQHSCGYWEVVAYYVALRTVLERMEKTHIPIIGDLSPYLIALSSAAGATGHSVISWQYGYVDFKHFPVRPTKACVLNERGIALARFNDYQSGRDLIYYRPGFDARPINLKKLQWGSVGVMLKAQSNKQSLSVLRRLARKFPKLIVRRHPNSSLDLSQLPNNVEVAPDEEMLSVFLKRVGIVICGNTTGQLAAVAAGNPVVQVSGLDPLPFDTYRFTAMGITFGCPDCDDISPHAVQDFYRDSAHQARVEQLFGPAPALRTPSLARLVMHLGLAEPPDCADDEAMASKPQ